MLSRNVRRALLDTRWQIPPTFLLPWAANLTTVSQPPKEPSLQVKPLRQPASKNPSNTAHSNRLPLGDSHTAATTNDALQLPSSSQTSVVNLSTSVRELLPLLNAQGPHYITVHIYDRPYLLTEGDTLRLPFLMHGVEPGDILRLDRASNIGSRDYTLKAAAAAPALRSPTTSSTTILDPTTGDLVSPSVVMPTGDLAATQNKAVAPHFIPHIAKGKVSCLDSRLFVCRAVVMGVESEPLRIVEKTKRRQRRVHRVKSKHRHTILRIREVRVRSLEEIEAGAMD